MKSEVTQIPPSDFAVMSDFNNLYQSYLDARKGKRWKMAAMRTYSTVFTPRTR